MTATYWTLVADDLSATAEWNRVGITPLAAVRYDQHSHWIQFRDPAADPALDGKHVELTVQQRYDFTLYGNDAVQFVIADRTVVEGPPFPPANPPEPVKCARRDPCPACNDADLEPTGGKHRCPKCGYLQPCCNP